MKRIVSLLAILAVVYGCEKGLGNENANGTRGEQGAAASLVGTWHSTHQEFKRIVEKAYPAELNAERSKETSVDTTEEDEYRLSFKEDGTGSGSGLAYGGKRCDFGFTWKLSDDLIDMSSVGPTAIVLPELGSSERRGWTVEEFSADKMVLSVKWTLLVDTTTGGWWEDNTVRYTFERVGEQ